MELKYSKDDRNDTIDVIKGICIIFVIITHFKWKEGEHLKYLLPYWTDMAVPIFMIISGYVYSNSYKRKNITSLFEAYTLNNVIKSIIRYTFPYIIILLIEVFLLDEWNGLYNLVQLFVCGGKGPGSYYYPIMIQFIFVFPIIYFLIKKLDLLGFMICATINIMYEVLQTLYKMNNECYRLLIFRYILVIAFGCYFVLKKNRIKARWKIITFLIGLGFITFYYFGNYIPYTITKWIGTSWLASLYILPISCFLLERSDVKFKIVAIIGKASYNIFLVQMVYFSKLSHICYSSVENRKMQFLFNLLWCIGVGVIFYWIEKPMTTKLTDISTSLVLKINTSKVKEKIEKMVYEA